MFAGQYSYIDENGNTIVVKYSAGVNGFRYLSRESHLYDVQAGRKLLIGLESPNLKLDL